MNSLDDYLIDRHGLGATGTRDPTNSSSFEVWSKFFISAGIPQPVAHDYAVTFSQHRIRIDMLKEITKDILLDMGIKAMGDIIAILRHAKTICTANELQVGPKVGVGAHSAVSGDLGLSLKRHTTDTAKLSSSSKRAAATTTTTPTTTTTTNIKASSRSSSNANTLVGNKIQSRLNLSSGALVASTINQQTASNSSNSKRASTTISSSLAKRLRPAPDTGYETNKNLPEKTLTVHYPSSSAIARAQQRISTNTEKSMTNNINNNNNSPGLGSIKSRLGGSAIETNRFGRSEPHSNDNEIMTRSNHPLPSNRSSNYKPNSNSSTSLTSQSRTSNNRGVHDRLDRFNNNNNKRDNEKHHQSNSRPKSTVFSRLGEASRY